MDSEKMFVLRNHTFEDNIKCDKCNVTFYNLEQVEVHIISVHIAVQDTTCDLCEGKTVTGKKQHMKTVHAGAKAFKCDFCDIRTNFGRLLLTSHIMNAHYKNSHCKKNKFKEDTLGSTPTYNADLELNQEEMKRKTIEKEFLRACKNKNTEKVARILEQNEITPEKLNKMCMLHKATRWYDVELVRRLLNFGASPNVRNQPKYVGGDTPLLLAARNGDLDIVKELLKFGAKVNVKDSIGLTPIFYAAEYGHFEIVRELLKKGAKANMTAEHILRNLLREKTPRADKIANELIKRRPKTFSDFLHDAVYCDNVDFVKKTLECGAHRVAKKINSRDSYTGETPLQIAIEKKNLEMVKILKDHGAEENPWMKSTDPENDLVTPQEYLKCLHKVMAFAQSRGISETNFKTLQDLVPLAFKRRK